MAPRAFQTMLVGPMGTKDRLELESRVLAAALKQSFERGDSVGVSLAHRQIFLLLKAAKKAEASGSGSRDRGSRRSSFDKRSQKGGREARPKKDRVMPHIVWTEEDSTQYDEEDTEVTEETHAVPIETDNSDKATQSFPAAEPVPESEAARVDAKESEPIEGESSSQVLGPFVLQEGAQDAYSILRVEQVASFEEIHRNFFRLVKRLLVDMKKATRKRKKELLLDLQQLWIAHDVLTDPVTRTDYDFRILGLRGAPDVIIDGGAEEGEVIIGSEIPLRIGELLQCAGLLEPTELEIAADMHKAMPEMLFGAFLVKQGFITEEDLEQVLMGQRLLKMGYMSVGTFQACMKEWREESVYIQDSAVAHNLISKHEMDRIVAQGLMDTDTEIPAINAQGKSTGMRTGLASKIQYAGTGQMINEEEARKRQVSAGHAVPGWKDQLDWSAPPQEERAPKLEVRNDDEIERSRVEIEGITDGVAEDPTPLKKSLRSLMKGIHAPSESEQSAALDRLNSILAEPEATSETSRTEVPEENPSEEVAPEAVAKVESPPTSEWPVDTVSKSADDDRTRSVELPRIEAPPPPLRSIVTEFSMYDDEDEPLMELDESAFAMRTPSAAEHSPVPVPTEVKPEPEKPEPGRITDEIFDFSTDIDSNPGLITGTMKAHDYAAGAEGGDSNSDSSDSASEIRYEDDDDDATVDLVGLSAKPVTEDLLQPADLEQLEELQQLDELGAPADDSVESEGSSDTEFDETETTEEMQAVSAAEPIAEDSDPKLKSGEWQLVFKIQGSLADVLLSDTEDDTVPRLTPRIDDIDMVSDKVPEKKQDQQQDPDQSSAGKTGRESGDDEGEQS